MNTICAWIHELSVFLVFNTRAEGRGGEAAGRPNELSGHRSREDETIPAGNLRPEVSTLSAGARNGRGAQVIAKHLLYVLVGLTMCSVSPVAHFVCRAWKEKLENAERRKREETKELQAGVCYLF